MVFADPRSISLLSTIWYELHAREWPYKSQPAEAIIWQIGSGMKPNLTQTGMGKEISVSSPWSLSSPSTHCCTVEEVLKMRLVCNTSRNSRRGSKGKQGRRGWWNSHSHNVEATGRIHEEGEMNKQGMDVCQLQVGEVLRTRVVADRTVSCLG